MSPALRAIRIGLSILIVVFAVSACGDEPDRNETGENGDNDTSEAAQPEFGEETTAVVVVNPVINEGSTTDATPGDARSGIHVGIAEEGPATETDDTGLAVLTNIPTGELQLEIGDDTVDLTVHEPGELYDVVVTYRDGVADHVIDPVRYPIGGDVVHLEDGDSLENAVDEGTVVFLGPGSYASDFELRAEDVLIFGSWDPEDGPLAVLENDLEVRGEPVRIRSVDIEGTISSPANDFSMSFSRVEGADVTGNGVSLIRNDFLGEAATSVPSSNAVLVDNDGIE